jgi:hypothetical protein
MKTINFYTQMRADGGRRTGVEIDGETVLARFEPGTAAEDPALLWFVDVRCSGGRLPDEPEAAREWLIKKAPKIQAGLTLLARDLRAGIDFSAPTSREIAGVETGIRVKILCSAVRRLTALKIAGALAETGAQWTQVLNQLEVLEPVGR